MIYRVLCVVLVSLCWFTTAHAKYMPQASYSAFENVAQAHEVEPSLLYAIALRESGHTVNGRFQPHPWAIAVGYDPAHNQLSHHAIYPDSYEDAVSILSQLIAAGYENLGIGLMQINLGANHRIIDDPLALLIPTHNLELASKVLKYCKRFGSEQAMLSCYRTGKPDSPKGLEYAMEIDAMHDQYSDLFATRYTPQGRLTFEQLIDYQHHRSAIVHPSTESAHE